MGMPTTYVQATPDILMGDLLKNMRSSQIFSVCGQPDVALRAVAAPDGAVPNQTYYEVQLRGLDVFDPVTMDLDTRSGLDVRTRELISLTMLAALGGCEPQIKLHVAANLRVGNDRARLVDVLTQLLPYIGYPRMLNALRALNEALDS
jgi:AhpD family alkylhydroperoxidase